MSLTKLLPLTTLVAGGVASKGKIEAQINKIKSVTEVVAVQQEVNDLAKMVYLDTIDETAPRPEQFVDYARRNMKPKVGQTRDTSKDFWGTEYRLIREEKKLVVTSAGPDRQFDTSDDIYSGYNL